MKLIVYIVNYSEEKMKTTRKWEQSEISRNVPVFNIEYPISKDELVVQILDRCSRSLSRQQWFAFPI